MVLGLDMRFLGGKRRKKMGGQEQRQKQRQYSVASPLGFAPAFGRAVAIGPILRRFSQWTVLRLVFSPENQEGVMR
jgi:hypothetical protein